MDILEKLFGKHHRSSSHADRPHERRAYAASSVAAICPSCQASIASSSRFCPQCGNPVLPRACRHCNASQPAGARFCGQCGQPAH